MKISHLSVDLILQVLSSWLMFIVMIASVECLLYFFGIKSPRQRVLFRLIPFIKIPFDFTLFKVPTYNFLYHVNLLHCESSFQKWIMAHLPDSVKLALGGSLKPTISHILTFQVSSFWLETVCGLILLISVFRLVRKMAQLFSSAKYLKSMDQSATPCLRPIV